MADEHERVESEEQIDLDGENDMDDEEEAMYDEENAEDESYEPTRNDYREENSSGDVRYKRIRDEYDENQHSGDDNSYKRGRDEYRVSDDDENDKDFENEEPKKRVEKKVETRDEADIEKRAELLALPPHGTEIFIGALPRDVTEEDIRNLCEPYGEVFEVKMVKDKETRESKGFAFVIYTTKAAAQEAIENIQLKEFKGKTLRCSLSQVKNRLFVGNVPKNLSEEEIKDILDEIGPGVVNIEVFKDNLNPGRNRGFVFVEFYNHSCAEYARAKMTNGKFRIDGSTPTITWADPKNVAEASAASQVKALYVKNLPDGVTSEKLKAVFERHGEVTKVVLPPSKPGQSKRDFGFVYYAERSSALKAVKEDEKYEIDGQTIEAVIAKPQTDKKASDHTKPSYKSGPPTSYPQYPSYGGYNAGSGYGGGVGQPVIYGRGPMPTGMAMVPMVLPDGRIGYVLQQPGMQSPPPPPSSRRSERGGGSGDRHSRDRDYDRSQSRRYRPY